MTQIGAPGRSRVKENSKDQFEDLFEDQVITLKNKLNTNLKICLKTKREF